LILIDIDKFDIEMQLGANISEIIEFY